VRRLQELEELNERANSRARELATKIEERSASQYYKEIEHENITADMEVENQRIKGLQQRCVLEASDQKLILDEKQQLLETEMYHGTQSREQLVVMKGEEDIAHSELRDTIAKLMEKIPKDQHAETEKLQHEIDTVASHIFSSRDLTRKLREELAEQGLVLKTVQQHVRSLEKYRIDSIFRIFKYKAEYSLMWKKLEQEEADAEAAQEQAGAVGC